MAFQDPGPEQEILESIIQKSITKEEFLESKRKSQTPLDDEPEVEKKICKDL